MSSLHHHVFTTEESQKRTKRERGREGVTRESLKGHSRNTNRKGKKDAKETKSQRKEAKEKRTSRRGFCFHSDVRRHTQKKRYAHSLTKSYIRAHSHFHSEEMNTQSLESKVSCLPSLFRHLQVEESKQRRLVSCAGAATLLHRPPFTHTSNGFPFRYSESCHR